MPSIYFVTKYHRKHNSNHSNNNNKNNYNNNNNKHRSSKTIWKLFVSRASSKMPNIKHLKYATGTYLAEIAAEAVEKWHIG